MHYFFEEMIHSSKTDIMRQKNNRNTEITLNYWLFF